MPSTRVRNLGPATSVRARAVEGAMPDPRFPDAEPWIVLLLLLPQIVCFGCRAYDIGAVPLETAQARAALAQRLMRSRLLIAYPTIG